MSDTFRCVACGPNSRPQPGGLVEFEDHLKRDHSAPDNGVTVTPRKLKIGGRPVGNELKTNSPKKRNREKKT